MLGWGYSRGEAERGLIALAEGMEWGQDVFVPCACCHGHPKLKRPQNKASDLRFPFPISEHGTTH